MKNLRDKLEDVFIDSGLDLLNSTSISNRFVRTNIEMVVWRLQDIIYFFNKPKLF